MAGFTLSEVIAADPETVFDIVTDFPGTAHRVSGIDRVEMLTEPPVGVGTRFRETRTMFGREATEEMEVTRMERPTSLVLEARSHGAHYVATHDLKAVAGGTELSLHFEARPESTGAKLMGVLAPLFMGSTKKAMATDMADLKRAAEDAGTGGGDAP